MIIYNKLSQNISHYKIQPIFKQFKTSFSQFTQPFYFLKNSYLYKKTFLFSNRLYHMANLKGIKYLSQNESKMLDEALMGPIYQFSVDQLMELAGLSVASVVHHIVSPFNPPHQPRVLIYCGPGNNGGDGLVAARHLCHFGHKVTICYPLSTNKILYQRLLAQCHHLGIIITSQDPLDSIYNKMNQIESDLGYDIIVDAIFGFSFKGKPRPPFDSILSNLIHFSSLPLSIKPKLVCVDIPSGWNVETGNTKSSDNLDMEFIHPDVLVSLSAPKLCASFLQGRHFLGGRFIPLSLQSQYGLEGLSQLYPSFQQFVEITDISPIITTPPSQS